ncbi:MAG: UDP-N-acetylmuramoyl-L-alanyl-D-glutamate--2,6-diaminopimelate ligase [Puniceicoccales bacterium]|nr:UDP-N-acetylmuramoyl-L-alanyl-D-glutamate--2,6-diaminopimelate ligase [Puniceicoccales bacterium]
MANAALLGERIGQVSFDSREIIGDLGGSAVLFFSVDGKNFKGEDFIRDVFKKNSRAIVVSERDLSGKCDRFIRVDDIEKTMAIVAKNFYWNPDSKLNLVGITGTNGKTTTSHLCRSMLGKIGRTGMIGTTGHDLCGTVKKVPNTTPAALTLFQSLAEAVKNGGKNLALEISSHAVELKRAYGLEVDVAIFTNLSPEHLDFHGTMEHYFLSKKKIFDGENGPVPQFSVINTDDEYGKRLYGELRRSGGTRRNVISFGFADDADFRICNVSQNCVGGSIFEILAHGKFYRFTARLFGTHNFYNIAASFAGCVSMFGSAGKFVEAVSEFERVPGRLDRIPMANGASAFVDYAHTPDALKAVVGALNSVKTGKLITVFGCGGDRDAVKRAPMTRIVNRLSDFAIATSDNPRNEPQESIFNDMEAGVVDRKKIVFIPDRREAIATAIDLSGPGDVILVAGKGHETYQLINGQCLDFDDGKVIVELSSKKMASPKPR